MVGGVGGSNFWGLSVDVIYVCSHRLLRGRLTKYFGLSWQTCSIKEGGGISKSANVEAGGPKTNI